MATPSPAEALTITAPATANLGSVPTGTASRSAQLGSVTATASGVIGVSLTVTVTCTNFTTGAAGANETIGNSSVAYWSGPATASIGLGSNTPGQVDAAHAQDLSVPRTAFQAAAVSFSVSVTWHPTIVINIPPAAVAGTYTATVTHSVA